MAEVKVKIQDDPDDPTRYRINVGPFGWSRPKDQLFPPEAAKTHQDPESVLSEAVKALKDAGFTELTKEAQTELDKMSFELERKG